jgi:phytoene dehydrogenase-like protein
MRIERSADAIVIGSGHNGLVAACYLAKAGLDVLVCEANDWIGGCTSTSSLIPEAPEHRIGPCAQDFCLIRLSTIVDDLDLRSHGYAEIEVDPAYVIPGPDGETLAFWRDPVRTAQEIRRFSRRDARAYLDFLELLEAGMGAGIPYVLGDPTRPSAQTLREGARAAVRHPRRLASLARMAAGSAADAIDARFTHPLVRGGLLALAAVGAPVTEKGSGVNALFPAIVRHAGVARPVGGAQVLPDALKRCLEAHGGRVRTSAEVTGVLTAGGRASGVRLASGEELAAGVVVSAMDPATTLRDLVPAGVLPDRVAARVAKIPSDSAGAAYLTVHLALSGQLDFSRLQAQRDDGLDLRRTALLSGSFEDMVEAVQASQAGRLPAAPPVAIIAPTGVDPSQAPPGQDTVYLWSGWAPRRPPEGWDALAPRAGQDLVDQASRYVDGLGELEIGRFVEPWTVLHQRTRVPDGNPYYVDLVLQRNGPLRPAPGLGGYTTPVPGLFLSGGGTHPGPSVSGLPGQIAARKVLATMPGLPRRPRAVPSPSAPAPRQAVGA